MEGDRTTWDVVDRFIAAAVGFGAVREGAEGKVREELETFIHALPIDPMRGDVDHLPQALDRFLDRMEAAAYLDVFNLPDEETIEDLYQRLRQTVEDALEVRAQVQAEGSGASRTDTSLTRLTEHVQAFVQAVKEFIQGRELEAPTQEHGAER